MLKHKYKLFLRMINYMFRLLSFMFIVYMYGVHPNLWPALVQINEIIIHSVHYVTYIPVLYESSAHYSNLQYTIYIKNSRINFRKAAVERLLSKGCFQKDSFERMSGSPSKVLINSRLNFKRT